MHRNADVYRKSHHIKSSNIPFSSTALFPKLPLFANVYLSDGLVNCIGFQPSILGYLWKTYDTEDVPSVTGACDGEETGSLPSDIASVQTSRTHEISKY